MSAGRKIIKNFWLFQDVKYIFNFVQHYFELSIAITVYSFVMSIMIRFVSFVIELFSVENGFETQTLSQSHACYSCGGTCDIQ